MKKYGMFSSAVPSQSPLRGHEEVESILSALGDEFPFGVYDYSLEVGGLDDVQVLDSAGAQRTPRAKPLVDRNRIDDGLRTSDSVRRSVSISIRAFSLKA